MRCTIALHSLYIPDGAGVLQAFTARPHLYPTPRAAHDGTRVPYTLRAAQITTHFSKPPHPSLFYQPSAVKFSQETPPYRIPYLP